MRIRWPNVPSVRKVDAIVHLDDEIALAHFTDGGEIGDWLMKMPVGTSLEIIAVNDKVRKDQVFYP